MVFNLGKKAFCHNSYLYFYGVFFKHFSIDIGLRYLTCSSERKSFFTWEHKCYDIADVYKWYNCFGVTYAYNSLVLLKQKLRSVYNILACDS